MGQQEFSLLSSPQPCSSRLNPEQEPFHPLCVSAACDTGTTGRQLHSFGAEQGRFPVGSIPSPAMDGAKLEQGCSKAVKSHPKHGSGERSLSHWL